MLDHQHRVAAVDELVQHVEQHPHVLEVQASRRFIEDVKRAPGVATREFGRELDTLRFAAGQRRRALAEVDVAQAHVIQRHQLVVDARLVLEERDRVLHRHVEHFTDRKPAELHIERLTVVPLAAALLARDIHIREEVHLDLDETIALAGLAAPTLHVEGEASRAVTAQLRLRHLGEEFPNGRKEPRIRRRVRARGAPDRRLVDIDDLVEVLEAGDALVGAGDDARAEEMARKRLLEDILHERALARPRHTGHRHEEPKREFGRHVAEVVLLRPLDANHALRIARTPALGALDLLRPIEILRGDALLDLHHFLHRALGDHFAAMLAGAGTEIDQVIGLHDRLFIVLHDEHRVAKVAQPLERLEKARVVALMEAD